MSSLPWKQDWTTSDRYQALFGAPIYEAETGMYVFKDNPHYVDGNDYLHAYWYARRELKRVAHDQDAWIALAQHGG